VTQRGFGLDGFRALMTPGLALFYGGMVRAERAVDVHAQLLRDRLVTIAWVTIGYSLAFAPTKGRMDAPGSRLVEWSGARAG
jgi:ammonia channel protein AmtB